MQYLLNLFPFLFNEKVQKIINEKNQALPNYQKNKNHELFWIHAASGEFEYARPVIRELKKRSPDSKILVTYSSISAKSIIQKNKSIDYSCMIPWEKEAQLQDFLMRFTPQYLFIARTDAWPVMIDQCFQKKIPIFMFSATFADESPRLKFPTKYLTQKSYEQMNHIFCVTQQDQQNIQKISPQINASVAGDTRFDQVIDRIAHAQSIKSFKIPSLMTFVAGSTWPEDELAIIPNVCQFIKEKQVQLIIAPHEVDEIHLTKIESLLNQHQLQSVRYSQINSESKLDIIIIDIIGILAEAYLQADFAFVGGSFKKQVHSVMEPLAAGLPTIVGPFYQNNREAIDFSQIHISNHFPIVQVAVSDLELASSIQRVLQQNNVNEIKLFIQNLIHERAGATNRFLDKVFSKQ